jgi:hypothetical protein
MLRPDRGRRHGTAEVERVDDIMAT